MLKKIAGRRVPIDRILILAVVAVFLFASLGAAIYAPAQDDDDGDILASGDTSASSLPGSWNITKPAKHGEIEGYASVNSTTPGATVGLDVSCSGKSQFKTDIYRMGYYAGQGAKLMGQVGYVSCSKQKAATVDPNTAMVDTVWSQTKHLVIPATWQPGYYLARLTTVHGYQTFVPFLVRTPNPSSQYLFVDAVATSQAYNNWDSNSLYVGTNQARYGRSLAVSMNRPYTVNNGAGDFLDWEYQMVRYLERNNYQVDYATDLDIYDHPGRLLNYKAVILTGHDEYWSWSMQQGYQRAVNAGVNLAIFGANMDYRPVRITRDPTTRQPDRVIIDAKAAHLDPVYKTYVNEQLTSLNPRPLSAFEITAFNWRDLGKPESQLNGEAYSGLSQTPGDYTVDDSSNWIFTHTGLANGDVIPHVVGYEFDKIDNSFAHPAGVADLMSSTLSNGGHANATIYTQPGGGSVFDAGTVQWSWGLEPNYPSYYSNSLETMTSNILDHFGS